MTIMRTSTASTRMRTNRYYPTNKKSDGCAYCKFVQYLCSYKWHFKQRLEIQALVTKSESQGCDFLLPVI